MSRLLIGAAGSAFGIGLLLKQRMDTSELCEDNRRVGRINNVAIRELEQRTAGTILKMSL